MVVMDQSSEWEAVYEWRMSGSALEHQVELHLDPVADLDAAEHQAGALEVEGAERHLVAADDPHRPVAGIGGHGAHVDRMLGPAEGQRAPQRPLHAVAGL